MNPDTFETDVSHLGRLFKSTGMELLRYGIAKDGWAILFKVPSEWNYSYLKINDQGVYKLDEIERTWDGMTWRKLKGVR